MITQLKLSLQANEEAKWENAKWILSSYTHAGTHLYDYNVISLIEVIQLDLKSKLNCNSLFSNTHLMWFSHLRRPQ